MKKGFILIGLLTFAVTAWAQDSYTKKIQLDLDQFNDEFWPEFMDVSLDKDFYFSGDRVWYSLFLNNSTGSTGSLSIVAYVEIRDKNDSVAVRQKVICKNGRAYGDILLPNYLSTGYYRLTAYTLWIRNIGKTGMFEALIPIININTPLAKGSQQTPQLNSDVLTIEEMADNLAIHISPGLTGDITAYSRDEVFFHQNEVKGDIVINCESVKDQHIFVRLSAPDGKVLAEQHVRRSPVRADATLIIDKKPLTPRGNLEFTVQLRDKLGNPVSGSASVSVRPASGFKPVSNIQQIGVSPLSAGTKNPQFNKEKFIYPTPSGSLPAIPFYGGRDMMPFPLSAADEPVFLAEIKKRTLKSFGQGVILEPDLKSHFPVNVSFQPSRYAPMLSIEDFIKEVVPQAKVRKVAKKKSIRIRNIDNPNNVYFFKGPPLVLVDGFITDQEVLFDVPLQDVEQIDILWSTDQINSLGIFSLTDNGIFSIRTRSRTARPNIGQLFKDFNNPLTFAGPSSETREESIPRFFDPIYWNPHVDIDGRTKLSIPLSDDLGTIVVEIKGVTQSGEFFSTQAEIQLTFGAN